MLGRDYHNLPLLGVILYLFDNLRPSLSLSNKDIIQIGHIPLDLVILVVNRPYRLNRLHLGIRLSRTIIGRVSLDLHKWKIDIKTIRLNRGMGKYLHHRPNQLENPRQTIKVISHGINRLNLLSLHPSNTNHHHPHHNLITIHISNIDNRIPQHHRFHPTDQLLPNLSPNQDLQLDITPLMNFMLKNLREIRISHLNHHLEGVHHNLLPGSKRHSHLLGEVHLNHLLGNSSRCRGLYRLNRLFLVNGNSNSNSSSQIHTITKIKRHHHRHCSTISDTPRQLLLRTTSLIRIHNNRLQRTPNNLRIPHNKAILKRGINP
jgi:hypothetical protein